MSYTEGVEVTLRSLWKTRQTVLHSHSRHALASTGQHLVRIALVADIPHYAVIGRVENMVKCNGEFDNTQACAKVAAGGRDGVQQKLSQFIGKSDEFVRGKIR